MFVIYFIISHKYVVLPKVNHFRNLQKSTPQVQCVENPTTKASTNSSPTNLTMSSPLIEA